MLVVLVLARWRLIFDGVVFGVLVVVGLVFWWWWDCCLVFVFGDYVGARGGVGDYVGADIRVGGVGVWCRHSVGGDRCRVWVVAFGVRY